MAKEIKDGISERKPLRAAHTKEKAPIKKGKEYIPIGDLKTDGNGVDYYDKYLIDVQRKNNGQYGITVGIQVSDLVQPKMPNHQETIDALNAAQDWQNPADGGKPKILWYFLHGSVTVGDIFQAHDLYWKANDPEDENPEEEFTARAKEAITVHGKPKIARLNITDKQIKSWKPGKNTPFGTPIFVD